MNLRLRLAIEWLVIGVFVSAVVVAALLWRGTASFDNLLYDRLSAAARPAAEEKILLVSIDDPSLAALGKWPWDRATHARLIEHLQAKQPRSITFDILLSETGDAAADAELAKAMQRGPAPVFMPLHFSAPGSDGKAYDTILPASIFTRAVTAIGHANVTFDDDGIVRRASLCFRADGERTRWPHLMELAYRRAEGAASAAYRKGCERQLLLPYAKRGGFAEISYADLLSGDVPTDLVRGHDVIIGATATGMGDNFPTANGKEGLLSGVEIMANMLGAIRRNDFLTQASQGWTIGFSLLPLWLLMLGFLFWRPRIVLLASLLSLALILTASAALLWNGLWLAPGAALLGVLLLYPLWGWRRLQAMSDFMGSELHALEQEGEAAPLPVRPNRATDLVGRQSEALARAIDHMRDLRRFVSDTLADLPDPMFVTDIDGKVTLTNDMLDERLGEDIAGLPLAAALDRMVVPEDRAAVDVYLDKAKPEFVRFESPLDQTFVMRRSEVRSDAGMLHGHIHYLTDISDLARAEAEREEVLQLLSHDMRAPQSTIIAILDGEINAEAKKRIERNARRTMQLAQDFVDIARMGETDFAGEDVLLVDLVREVADSLWPLAGERGIKFAFGDNSNSAFVIAEPERLFRAFCNLIDNAIKFSPNAGTISIAIARQDSDITVTIRDNGPGIAPDILPRLFSRFASGGEHQGRVQGSGLGLTFVQAVIARHGGSVSAANGAEAGAVFTVMLAEAPSET